MAKSKQSLSPKANKKMQKEIRSAQKVFPLVPSPIKKKGYSDPLAEKELKKMYPRAKPANKKAAPKSNKKFISKKFKLNTATSKTSKRTTPGVPERGASPASTHKEGEVWIRTTVKQNLAKRAIQTHKATKKK